jgi:hypothetical protein
MGEKIDGVSSKCDFSILLALHGSERFQSDKEIVEDLVHTKKRSLKDLVWQSMLRSNAHSITKTTHPHPRRPPHVSIRLFLFFIFISIHSFSNVTSIASLFNSNGIDTTSLVHVFVGGTSSSRAFKTPCVPRT